MNAAAEALARLLAALTYGERCAAARARGIIRFAPDGRAREEQTRVAEREEDNCALMEARLAELGSMDDAERFKPFFDSFFERTEPSDWIEAQAWHYVGDALVSDFAEVLIEVLDPVSAQIIRRTLGDRQDQETFALDELKRVMEADPGATERIAAFSRKIAGEALTQTRHAMTETLVLFDLLGGDEAEKALVLRLLEGHRARLDRLGVDPLDPETGD
ncbi:MAG: ferritin-like fold-containing protein [Actinomycetota bacterium]